MNRRQFLAGVGTGALAGSAGCLFLQSGPDRPRPRDDRPVVDETWAAAPTEPTCESSGEEHYPFLNRQTEYVAEYPESGDLAAVEAFVEGHIQFTGDVTLREDKPARVAWHRQEFDVSERYGTDVYYVGWVGEVGGSHRLLVLIADDGTRIVNFLGTEECPGAD